ncbi:hypothetical protein CIPAW_09G055300 [Carya illinoinensis]|uniref:Uncharacterized protein n=1 Tax=Carya illinoinensis TaxID=32201 RepID=A0A8T1PHV7_CARIL|nr:hypothetical protein CIPAW_09G055300 [Carya illinoinensis]
MAKAKPRFLLLKSPVDQTEFSLAAEMACLHSVLELPKSGWVHSTFYFFSFDHHLLLLPVVVQILRTKIEKIEAAVGLMRRIPPKHKGISFPSILFAIPSLRGLSADNVEEEELFFW